MGRYCLPFNVYRFNAALRKNLRPLWSPYCFPIRNRDIPYWFICSWCIAGHDPTYCHSRSSGPWGRGSYGPYLRDYRRHRASSRTWSLPRLLRCSLGTFICCRSVARWIFLRPRNHSWNHWMALDFLHQSSIWNCSAHHYIRSSTYS